MKEATPGTDIYEDPTASKTPVVTNEEVDMSKIPAQIVGFGERAPIVWFRDTGSHVEIETSRGLTCHIGGEYDLPGWGRCRLNSAGGREGGGLRLTVSRLGR